MTHSAIPSRRDLLHAAAAASLTAAIPALAAGEPPPETKRIRLMRFPFGSNLRQPDVDRAGSASPRRFR